MVKTRSRHRHPSLVRSVIASFNHPRFHLSANHFSASNPVFFQHDFAFTSVASPPRRLCFKTVSRKLRQPGESETE